MPVSIFLNEQGFEWNKYNQTHYDIDNPPPKIVQGYKFNVSIQQCNTVFSGHHMHLRTKHYIAL